MTKHVTIRSLWPLLSGGGCAESPLAGGASSGPVRVRRVTIRPMGQGPASDDPEIPDWVLGAGRLIGLRSIQTRWKLLAAHRRWRSFRRELEPASRGFEHQICGACGAVQPHEAKVCSSCGDKLASPAARFLRKVGLSVPTFLSVSSVLGLAMRAFLAEPRLAAALRASQRAGSIPHGARRMRAAARRMGPSSRHRGLGGLRRGAHGRGWVASRSRICGSCDGQRGDRASTSSAFKPRSSMQDRSRPLC
jgi:ribosomal protein L40E